MGMRRIPPEYLDPETSDRSVAADVLVQEEPTKKKMKRETAKKKRAKKKRRGLLRRKPPPIDAGRGISAEFYN